MNLKDMFSKKNRIMLKAMVSTDFKLRYQQSFLGYIWSVLKPLMLFAIMYVVFVKFMRFGDSVPHFSVGLLLGIIMWNFFVETVSGGLISVVNHGDLMRKINFSKFVVVISSSLSALINFGISFVVVLIFMVVNGVAFTWSALLIFPIVLELYLFSLAVSLLFGTWYVYFRDLQPIWEVITQAGFYATPIIYPVSMVAAISPFISRIFLLNPMAQMVQDARHVLISPLNITVWESFSNIMIPMIPILFTIVLLIIGIRYFNSKAPTFAEMV